MSIGENYKYLHYWFYSSGMTLYDFDQARKKTLLNQFKTQMNLRKKLMISADTKELMKEGEAILDFLISPKAKEKRNSVYNPSEKITSGPRFSGLQTSQGKDLTYGQLKNLETQEILNMINNLVNGIYSFSSKLEEWIEEAYTALGTGQTYESYKNLVISEYIETKGLSDITMTGDVANKIISDLLMNKHNSIGVLDVQASSNAPKALNTALRNLVLVANAIPLMSTVEVYKQGTVQGSSVLNIIAGKIAGMFRNVKGGGGEVAAAIAEKTLEQELLQEFDAIINTNVHAGGKSVKKVVDKNYYTKEEMTDRRVSKGDVLAIVSKKGISIEYGISVKDYTFPSNGDSMGKVDIVSRTPFLAAAHKANISDYYLINLAASHGLDRKSGFKNEDLNKAWIDLTNYVVYFNLLDFLAGTALENQDNVLFFNINGKIFTIWEILEGIESGTDMAIDYILGDKDKNVKERKDYVAKNNWISVKGTLAKERIKDKALGWERSNKAWSQVYQLLKETKLFVSLKILAKLVQ